MTTTLHVGRRARQVSMSLSPPPSGKSSSVINASRKLQRNQSTVAAMLSKAPTRATVL
jgi:hypothetical protein